MVRCGQRHRNEKHWLSFDKEVLDGFKYGNSDDPVTKGLSVWSEPILSTDDDGSKVALLIMDAEGLFNDQGNDDITVINEKKLSKKSLILNLI